MITNLCFNIFIEFILKQVMKQMFKEQRPWNGAGMEQRQLIEEQRQWSNYGMEQRLEVSQEMKGRQVGNSVAQVEKKKCRESSADGRDHLEANEAFATALVLAGWTKCTYIKYCNKFTSDDHESTEANVKSRVIEELNECVASASVDVEDSSRVVYAFEC